MNKKYAICFDYEFGNDINKVKTFLKDLENLESLRDEFKDKVDYFWGMRKNWFPLILLKEVKLGNQAALQLFNKMISDKNSHSIYYKGWKKAWVNPYRGLDDRVYYVLILSLETENLKYVEEILINYGFHTRFTDDLKSIWPYDSKILS